MSLHISDSRSLPIDAATQTFAFIARKGGGKTYGAGKLVEELMNARVQCLILDTVGNWYGLRLAKDGKAKGFDIPVFGGLRGDLPLQAQSGELVADIAVDSQRSLIIDISQFSLADRKRFATAFGEQLWKKKKAEKHPTPVMLVIEESQLIVPQNYKGAERMLGIYEEIIRLGRNYGIGCTMITQRPQSVNKEVLNQTECLFVGQVSGSQERDALKKWMTYQGVNTDMLDALPTLPVGTMYMWSPQWLRIFQKVKIARKATFDASATPKVGDNVERHNPAPLDLGEIKQRMAAIIEEDKRNDPRELHKQINDLHRQLHQAEGRTTKEEVPVEVPIIKDGQIERIETLEVKFGTLGRDLIGAVKELTETLNSAKIAKLHPINRRTFKTINREAFRETAPVHGPITRESHAAPVGKVRPPTEGLSGSQQRIIDEMWQLHQLGVREPTIRQIAVFCGVSHTTGSFLQNVRDLDRVGYIERGKGTARLTQLGTDSADTAIAGRNIVEMWLHKLDGAQAKMLKAIIGMGSATKAALAAELNVSPTTGSFLQNLRELRNYGVVNIDNGVASPSELLML